MVRIMRNDIFPWFRKAPLISGIILLGLLSCGDEYLLDNVDCSECYVPKPEYGPFTITLTPNDENRRIPVKIFKGKYQENFLKDFSSAVILDTVSVSNYVTDLKVNEYYSVAAEYTHNGQKVIVVDGDRLRIYKVSDNCDEICWIFRGGKVDASLKQ